MDAYDHIAKNTKTSKEFYEEAKQPFINAGNSEDQAPATDVGYNVQIDQQPIHWAGGDGRYGSEKLDAYGHIGINTKKGKFD